jgi:hypothetical protein
MAIPFKSEEIAHKEFLKYQIAIEKAVDKLHKDTEIVLNKIIMRNTNVLGTIDKIKIKKIVDVYIANELNQYRRSLISAIRGGVLNSSKLGIRSIIAAVAPHRKLTALTWQNTAKKIRKNITSRIGIDGLTLSERVWKVSSDAMYNLKKAVSSDILQGNSAVKISRDIRGYLLQPETLRGRVKDLLHPGQGVYKSAYKNAMRVTRTEIARAYIDGQKETTKYMGYKMQLKRSGAATPCDICDPLEGNIYEPRNFPAPLHPHCMCFALTVLAQ